MNLVAVPVSGGLEAIIARGSSLPRLSWCSARSLPICGLRSATLSGLSRPTARSSSSRRPTFSPVSPTAALSQAADHGVQCELARRSVFAVLYLDIDDFKDVNDTLGHAMGDLLLKEVVERIREAVGQDDLVARFGGDEFAILVLGVTDPNVVGALAARNVKRLGEPYSIEGHKLRITSSIGIALYSSEAAGPQMMVQADLALYGAKDEGAIATASTAATSIGGCISAFGSPTSSVPLDQGELELYYQPQVELSTGRIIGLEALIRWNHKTRGLLPRRVHSDRRADRHRASARQLGVRGVLPPAEP